MAFFTVELYTVVQNLTLADSDKTLAQRIDLALPQLFDFDFPIWSPEYKTTLERKIVMHYLQKEICCETLGLWKFFLNERLNLIMPYYNDLYKSTIQEYDFTKDHEENETITKDNTGTIGVAGSDSLTGTVTDSANNNNIMTNNLTNATTNNQVDCDTPQSRVSGADYASFTQEQIVNNRNTGTVTNAGSSGNTKTNNLTNGKSATTTNNLKESVTRNVSGNNSHIADLIMKYRDTLINIDRMIINELGDLFMTVFEMDI